MKSKESNRRRRREDEDGGVMTQQHQEQHPLEGGGGRGGEHHHHRPLLQQTFRVWCKNQVADYQAVLTPFSLVLQPVKGSRSESPTVNVCCQASHLPSSSTEIEIPSRDVVACRPATTVALDTKFNMGPPILMLVTYANVGNSGRKAGGGGSNARVVLYFHWSGSLPDGVGEERRATTRRGRRNREDAERREEMEVRALVDILRVKEEWVRAIHQVFFPLRAAGNLISNTTRLAFTSAFLSQKLLVLLNPSAGDGSALQVFRDRVVGVFKDAGLEYEVLVTERPGHARQVVAGENLARWRAVAAVGGDGTTAEVLAALFDRADWQDALSHLAVCSIPLPRCRSVFARSMAHAQKERFDVMGGVLNAARCQINPLDLIFVQTNSPHRTKSSSSSSRVASLDVAWHFSAAEVTAGSSSGSSSSSSSWDRHSRAMAILNKMAFRKGSDTVAGGTVLISYLPVVDSNAAKITRRTVPVKFDSPSPSSNSSPRSSRLQQVQQQHNIQQPESLVTCSRSHCSKEGCSLGARTCSTCSLSDRENVYRKEPPSSTSSSSASSSDDDSLEALIPPKNVVAVPPTAPAPSTKYTYTSLLAGGQLYFRSWQELDVRLGHTGPFPLFNAPTLMKPSLSGSDDGGGVGRQKRPKPCFPAMPDLPKSLPKDAGWVTEVGDFVCVHLVNHGFSSGPDGGGVLRLLAPEALPDDGVLWLLLVRSGVSRRELGKFLKSTEGADRQRLPPPDGVELMPVRGLRMTPLDVRGFEGFSVDGEATAATEGPVETMQAFVMPGVARTLVK